MSHHEVELVYELSPVQQAMLFHSVYSPESGVYVVQVSLRLTGRLDVDAFRRSWRHVVERHGILRTAFHWEELEKPVQVVYRGVDLEVEVRRGVDLLQKYLDEDCERGFDLSEPPLMRLALFEVGEGDHWFVWTQHHLLTDGWSTGVLLKELFTCYEAFAAGREPALERPRPYRDYIAWLQRQDLGAAEAFWRASLAGLSEPTLLAGGDGREAGGFRASRRRVLRLSAEETAALREAARRRRLTLNTLVQGAWAVLLAAWTGRRDVVFGGVVAGRPSELPGVESIVGPFLNTLPVRARIEPDLQLWPWLSDLQERQSEARRYEHAPLVEVQRWSGLPAGTPLFDTLLAFENYPLEQAADGVAGLTLSEVRSNELTNYPLNLVVAPGAELSLEMLFDVGRFEPAAVTRLQEHLANLLLTFAAGADVTLGDLPRLTEAERHQVLVEWNDTATAYPRESCLAELFEAMAHAQPDAPAVVTQGETWTYRRLDEASNRLARELRGLGVGAETPVGIAMERSPELILGVLAIVKAGGAYVPLDPGYPDERLDFMLADTGTRIVLVHDRTRTRFEGRAHLINVGGRGSLSREAGEGRGGGLKLPSESLACILYTSGSTGRPKGIALIQRAVARLVLETNFAHLGPGERTGHISSISFDAATYEIWGALLTGGAVAVVPREVVLSPVDFAAAIRDLRITSMILTSALFTRMAREVPGAFETMTELMVGGEAMDPSAARAVLADRPPPRLINAYGPAEGTTMASWYLVREAQSSVPIGRPLANTALHVLDSAGLLVPPGTAGELCVGGEGLARCYLNRPELTAERFTPDPWRLGERLYRTGDLVRQRIDGAIEFFGRLDHQVKIRGFRIEPGEIEAVLAGHPEVRECAVVARQDTSGETRLVAYAAGPRDGADLRGYLQDRLPEHMIPSTFVILEALPLTANGKLDRRALPAPERASSLGEGYAAPSDPVEELLAGIWSEVLGVERVGVHDDFFALGGHSLLATQVVSRIRGVLGVELPLRRLFESPTVAGLARAVRESQGGGESPPILPVPRDQELPLSFGQQRLWFLDQLEPGNPAYNVPLAVRLEGEVSPERIERVFAEVARRHEVLRTTFAVRDGRPVQVIAPALLPELERLDLSDVPEAERWELARRLAVEEARRPFDLQAGPLLRLALIRLAERDHLLLVTMHHIVADGWSLGVLLREIAALHEAFSEGRQAALPELPVQYADFAFWQRERLRGEALEAQLDFWRNQLAGAPRVLDLPLDRPRPPAQTYRGSSLAVALPVSLRKLCREEGVTLFMVLLAAWAALLGRHAGQEDVLVGTPIAGRNRREVEDLIGFFVNTLALRADLSGSPSFGELLGRVRQVALDAYAHQEVPFERLVEALVPERDLSHPPLFQTLLVFQNAPRSALSVPGLTLTPVPLDSGAAQLDLTLSLEERPAGIGGSLTFNADLFDASTAARLLARLEALLGAAVEDPGLALPELPLLPAAERHQVLLEWNDTLRAYASGVCLHELVALQAARTPDAVAASFEGAELTYRELDRRANRLAHHLIGLGVGTDERVGVLLERSLEMSVALLGVLKAGASYVPLDPTWPAERLAVLLESSGARVVLAQGRLTHLLPGRGERTVLLEEGWTGSGPDTDPRVPVGEDNLAYCLFTSGSTGTPKGVMTPHRGIVNRLLWMQEAYGLTPGDRVLQKTPFSFDVSLWELFWPLLVGARLVFARPEGHKDPAYLAEVIAREGITTIHFVPSMLQVFLDNLPVSVLSSLRRVVASGEALPLELVRRFFGRVSGAGLHNLYGPTEASVDVSFWSCEPDPPRSVVPIGRPIANLRLHVVDRELRPQPLGVPGELLLGGVGLARGYLGRPDLTAAAFVPDPFGGEAGGRLYRAGDLARTLPDGNVEFLGRIDHQVKIRGFRIELGEIEAVLAGCPGVRECVVLAREDAPGLRRLVAYVVRASDPGELRGYLAERLPEHMIPAAFVFLEALPLSPNGKVDRRALAAPDRSRQDEKAEIAAPRTRTEEVLVEIWKELLGVDRIGVEERFFDLGGHSLLATQVLARVRRSFGVEIALREVFRTPTVAGLAELIDRRVAVSAETAEPPEDAELAALLDELDSMSDEEARARLADLRTI